MSSRRPTIAPIVLGTLVVLAVAAPRAGDLPSPSPGSSPDGAAPPADIFAQIERGWVLGSADAVVEAFGQRKVYISLPDGGPAGGSFSRAQSYFIFKGFFADTRTEEFSFVSIRQLEEQPETAVGLAERTFRKRDSSRALQDRIYVALVRENDRWVVSEIKSVR